VCCVVSHDLHAWGACEAAAKPRSCCCCSGCPPLVCGWKHIVCCRRAVLSRCICTSQDWPCGVEGSWSWSCMPAPVWSSTTGQVLPRDAPELGLTQPPGCCRLPQGGCVCVGRGSRAGTLTINCAGRAGSCKRMGCMLGWVCVSTVLSNALWGLVSGRQWLWCSPWEGLPRRVCVMVSLVGAFSCMGWQGAFGTGDVGGVLAPPAAEGCDRASVCLVCWPRLPLHWPMVSQAYGAPRPEA